MVKTEGQVLACRWPTFLHL